MDWLSLIGMCLCVAVILYLAYWFTRRIAAGNLGGNMPSGGGHMRIYDRMPLGQNKAVVVARVGLRWLVLGVSDEQITLLTELSEEESRIWRQTKQVSGEAATPKFSDIISDVLRKKHDRK